MSLPVTDHPHPALTLGLVAYVWGASHQDRLLVECLAPAVAELRRHGLARRFWLDRFDARGPHVFAVLTVPGEAAPETARELAARLDRHLADHPSSTTLTPEQLGHRHRETRQRRQCAPDALPGFAPNNSFEIFEHPSGGYPFTLSAGFAREEDVWDLVADLTLWTIGHLAMRPGLPALAPARRWIASVDRELRLAGARPADYWRYHARSLLPDLLGKLDPEETDAVLAELAADVANPGLDQAWRETVEAGALWPQLPLLVRLLLGGSGASSPWGLLREIDHALLKQLGLPSVLHIPLVLYAWRRNAAQLP